MNDLAISPVTRDDLPALARLYEELSGEPGDLRAMAPLFDTMNRNPDYLLLGAKTGERLVGSAMGVVCNKLNRDCRPFMVMENFVVAVGCRRLGVGAALLSAIETAAAERNCGSVMFISSRRRPGAHAFYAAMGYDPDEVRGFRKKL